METPMIKLTDTQLAILAAAAERPDRNLLPLPGSLRGGAAGKVVGALLARGLVAETVTEERTKADPALNRVWRNEADGRAVLVHLTEAGLFAAQGAQGAATGAVEAREGTDAADGADEAPAGPVGATEEQDAVGDGDSAPEAGTGPTARATRPGTKQATLIAMLRSDAGATIDEIVSATGWQPHTVRGAMAGALKKRLGLEATSEKVEGRGRVYRLPPA
jgi:DNA-binding MarR family transcriptional regulator